MAPLAVDARSERGAGNRIAVVTEQAAIVGKTCEIGRCGIVVPRTHPPAPLLHVPGHRQFGKLPARRLVQVRAGMIARADRKGHFLLEYVHLGAARVNLMTALKEAASTTQHLIVPARAGMKKTIAALVIFDEGGVGRPRKGAGHTYVLII